MMATAVAAVIVGVFLTSSDVLRRAFKASDAYSSSKRDQMRLTDYLALDLRRALTVHAVAHATTLLTLTIPDYYNADGSPRVPTVNQLVAEYGDPAIPVTVTYFKAGASIYRRENNRTAIEVASNVNDFKITVEDLNKVVKTRVSFTPTFLPVPGAYSRESTVLHNTVWLRNKRRG
jgi:hypothetical protein